MEKIPEAKIESKIVIMWKLVMRNLWPKFARRAVFANTIGPQVYAILKQVGHLLTQTLFGQKLSQILVGYKSMLAGHKLTQM